MLSVHCRYNSRQRDHLCRRCVDPTYKCETSESNEKPFLKTLKKTYDLVSPPGAFRPLRTRSNVLFPRQRTEQFLHPTGSLGKQPVNSFSSTPHVSNFSFRIRSATGNMSGRLRPSSRQLPPLDLSIIHHQDGQTANGRYVPAGQQWCS